MDWKKDLKAAAGAAKKGVKKAAGPVLQKVKEKVEEKVDVKEAAFRAFAAVFNAAARLPVQKNLVVLLSMYDANFNDALGEVERELEKRDPRQSKKAKSVFGSYRIFRVSRNELFSSKASAVKFMTVDAFRMGRAKYIFLNNNFMAMDKMVPNKDTEIIQLWHGQGAFKKFGFDIPQPPEVRAKETGGSKILTWVVASSKDVAPIYAGAFGVRPEQVLGTGSPNEDWYFRTNNTSGQMVLFRRVQFNELYPQAEGKYLVLYAPTFRDDPGAGSVLRHLDIAALKRSVEDGLNLGTPPGAPRREACILIRLHPHDPYAGQVEKIISGSKKLQESVVDVNKYADVNELCVLSDLLITDYSSICMNFAMLRKPMVFYAYDLGDYEEKRDLYFDYKEYVPGPVVCTMDELCSCVAHHDYQTEKLEKFREFNFGKPDGSATKRMLDQIL